MNWQLINTFASCMIHCIGYSCKDDIQFMYISMNWTQNLDTCRFGIDERARSHRS